MSERASVQAGTSGRRSLNSGWLLGVLGVLVVGLGVVSALMWNAQRRSSRELSELRNTVERGTSAKDVDALTARVAILEKSARQVQDRSVGEISDMNVLRSDLARVDKKADAAQVTADAAHIAADDASDAARAAGDSATTAASGLRSVRSCVNDYMDIIAKAAGRAYRYDYC